MIIIREDTQKERDRLIRMSSNAFYELSELLVSNRKTEALLKKANAIIDMTRIFIASHMDDLELQELLKLITEYDKEIS